MVHPIISKGIWFRSEAKCNLSEQKIVEKNSTDIELKKQSKVAIGSTFFVVCLGRSIGRPNSLGFTNKLAHFPISLNRFSLISTYRNKPLKGEGLTCNLMSMIDGYFSRVEQLILY